MEEKLLNKKMSITQDERNRIVNLLLPENHGGKIESTDWSIYSFKQFDKNEKTGRADYSRYCLTFIAFIDDGPINIPKYFESDDLERVVLWLYKFVD
jgi:hypothetical protein